jgi:CRP-like cAMP-binding protein
MDIQQAVEVAVEPGEFLARLTGAEQAALFASGRRRRFATGAHLLVQGTFSDSVFVILAGRAKVFSDTENGVEVVLAVRGPGALLGELAAIDEEPRAASVRALEPVQTLAIPCRAFSDFLVAHPRVTLMLMRTLTSRLRDADRKRVEFGAYSTDNRVARRLVELADRFGEPTVEGVRITVPFTQDELAGWVGASREAVAKALRVLRARGIVHTERKTVVVRDLATLRARAGSDWI